MIDNGRFRHIAIRLWDFGDPWSCHGLFLVARYGIIDWQYLAHDNPWLRDST
jgi:hypothetical protein